MDILATTAVTESNNQRGVDMAWAAFRSAARTAEGGHFPEAVRMVEGQASHSTLVDNLARSSCNGPCPFLPKS